MIYLFLLVVCGDRDDGSTLYVLCVTPRVEEMCVCWIFREGREVHLLCCFFLDHRRYGGVRGTFCTQTGNGKKTSNKTNKHDMTLTSG